MKKNILLLAFTLINGLNAWAAECDKLLEGGLYSVTRMTNTGSFAQDLRTYYLSEQFKTDLRSGKWGGTVSIPIDNIPISIGMNDSEEKFSEFRSRIVNATQLKIESNFYQTSFSSMPNTNLYEAYTKCVSLPKGLSGFTEGLNVVGEDSVVFAIYYKPEAPGDKMPKVLSFNVAPAGSIVSGGLSPGDSLQSYAMLITVRRDPEKDLILSLNTDRGAISSKVPAPDGLSSGKELPVGTIIMSFLNFEQFSFTSKNNEKSLGGIWTAEKSRWAPADGRSVPGSKFSKIASQTNVPDLRGLFLRGLNSFDPAYTVPPQNQTQLNPQPTSVGTYQADELKSHTHSYVDQREPGNNTFDSGSNRGLHYQTLETSSVGGLETRPKNSSMYYYLKIN